MSVRAAGMRAATAARGRRMGTSAEAKLVVALVWAATRVGLVIVLLWSLLRGSFTLTEALSGWDAEHYIRLADHGYSGLNDWAFFPGLPLVLRGASAIGIAPPVAGALLSLVSSAFAAAALYRLGSQGWGWGKKHQPVAGAIAASAWLLAPTTVFTTVAYTEAPFCAAAFWAWERARAGKWPAAAVLAACACTLRVSGLFLIAALCVLAIVGNDRDDQLHRSKRATDWRSRVGNAAWLVIPAAALLAYPAWLYTQTGSWLTWFEAQQVGWSRQFTPPLEALQRTLDAAVPSAWPDRPRVALIFAAEVISMAVGVSVTLVCLVRRRWAEATWVGLQVVALGTSYWYMSINRAVLLWFPLFLAIGAVLGQPFQRRTGPWRVPVAMLIGVLAAISALVAAGWAWLLYTWQWAS
ncbi:mannosyltransferase family protein [Propionibacteriaceae bacterium G57]|uniref:mannosyltransferase family protein n=1 Tax=Aestuariimicrobium sp. G57 TaxID=3418485 RepID=UPI003DA6ECA9